MAINVLAIATRFGEKEVGGRIGKPDTKHTNVGTSLRDGIAGRSWKLQPHPTSTDLDITKA